MAEVVQLIKDNLADIIFVIVLIVNTVMAIVNSVKQGKFVRYSDIYHSITSDELVNIVLNLPKEDLQSFVIKLKEELEN